MTEPVLRAPDMCPDEVMKLCQNIYKVFLSPHYIARHLLNIRSFEDIRYIIKGAKGNYWTYNGFFDDQKID